MYMLNLRTNLGITTILMSCFLTVGKCGAAEDGPDYTDMATVLIKAAHPTGANPKLVSSKVTELPKGGYTIFLKLEYSGALTGKVYKAEATLELSDKGGGEWKSIQFKDLNNAIPPNNTNIENLRKAANAQDEKAGSVKKGDKVCNPGFLRKWEGTVTEVNGTSYMVRMDYVVDSYKKTYTIKSEYKLLDGELKPRVNQSIDSFLKVK